ncbi:terminal repeat-encoded protein [Staphylococcus phage phiSA12]|uniref:Terminal repeat-encoded protein n=1 Tax=Staphylococcus phage phiSA12 TaxID=1450142 RepID=W0TVP8_9CAUD|nr:terminal repeat-encoded protein [Staphylococcus phage phiSA12]BAO47048.1 terminal repeat-encoded protein [Staphylococcus phage phiSA12]
MTNTIQAFLQGQEASTVKDVATHGVQSGAIGKLIYTSDVVNFFDRYEQDIEAVITEYIEEVTGQQYYDLLNYELMRDLENYANVEFEDEDEYNNIQFDLAENIASDEIEGFEDMDEADQAEAVFEAMDDVELELQETDKVQYVNLAVEIVAQRMAL